MNHKAEQLVNAIKVPSKLSIRQVTLAKSFAKSKMMQGFTVGSWCGDNGLSSATFYSWMNEEDGIFKNYLNEISDAVVPTDEKDAYSKIKKKIMQIAEKDNPSIKEIELFTSTFAYVVENDKLERMQALGIANDNAKPVDTRTIDERRASLLSRLQPKGIEEK